jgi:uncharacterized zinc-type alcohol dehydrogenase-like protein
VGTGILVVNPADLFQKRKVTTEMSANIKSKGNPAPDTSGKLSPWEFERRALPVYFMVNNTVI